MKPARINHESFARRQSTSRHGLCSDENRARLFRTRYPPIIMTLKNGDRNPCEVHGFLPDSRPFLPRLARSTKLRDYWQVDLDRRALAAGRLRQGVALCLPELDPGCLIKSVYHRLGTVVRLDAGESRRLKLVGGDRSVWNDI